MKAGHGPQASKAAVAAEADVGLADSNYDAPKIDIE